MEAQREIPQCIGGNSGEWCFCEQQKHINNIKSHLHKHESLKNRVSNKVISL